jgi:hypothetical protein
MRIAILLLSGGVLLAGCKPAEPVADEREPQGREETRGIRNIEVPGYSGKEIADKVDATLEANDERNRAMEKADQ